MHIIWCDDQWLLGARDLILVDCNSVLQFVNTYMVVEKKLCCHLYPEHVPAFREERNGTKTFFWFN